MCNRLLRSILALTLGATQFAAARHPAIPGPKVPDGLGVNIHFTDPAEGEMELLAAAGFRWVRMDLGWAGIERERGKYDFSAIDRLVGQLEKHAIKAIFILDYSNPLYEKESSVRTGEGRHAFARWASAAAKRYQGRGFLWEVWNEPNIGFWKPAPSSADYSALSRAAAAAIHEMAPGEAVIGPASSGFDFPFMEACFKNGALKDWDAVSVHPYRQSGPENVVQEYAKLRHNIRESAPAGRDIPVISGEWGYSAGWQNFDEDLQGRMLAREFLTNLSQDIPLSIWYDWRDDGPDPKEPEHHFGTVGLPQKENGKPVFRIKPAYHAASTLTGTLKGLHFIRRLALGATGDWALLFGDDHTFVVACWTTAGEAGTIRIPVGDSKYRIVNHLGEVMPSTSVVDGSIEVPMDGAPRYLSFDRIVRPLMEIPATPAFTCDLVRAPGGVFLALVENPGGEAFTGSLRLTGGGAAKPVPFTLTDGETSKQIRFETRGGNDAATATGLEAWSAEHRIMAVPPRRFLLDEPALLSRCVAKADGDSKVVSTQTIAPIANPPGLPGFEAPVWELKCGFEPGWRFATFGPEGGHGIAGQPKAFGLWVLGDGSGIALRMRVRDANGRTWQPDGGSVTWHGWRHVRFALGPDTAHWGGQGDAAVRYPLQWDVTVLVDNTSRSAMQTRLLVTAPTTEE